MQGGVAGFGFPLPKDSVSPPLLCVVTSETAVSGPLRSPVKPIFEARLRQLSVRFLKRTWNTPGHVLASQLFPQGFQRRFVHATRSIVIVVCLPAPLLFYT